LHVSPDKNLHKNTPARDGRGFGLRVGILSDERGFG
jgi:hypothetical protein